MKFFLVRQSRQGYNGKNDVPYPAPIDPERVVNWRL